MTIKRILVLAAFAVAFTGCATTGHFNIPKDSRLELDGRPVKVDADGKVETRPFFWNASGGVPYRLTTADGKTYEGKVKSKFRVVSIFWPPAALIYWPMGLAGGDNTYDLTPRAGSAASNENVSTSSGPAPVKATKPAKKKKGN